MSDTKLSKLLQKFESNNLLSKVNLNKNSVVCIEIDKTHTLVKVLGFNGNEAKLIKLVSTNSEAVDIYDYSELNNAITGKPLTKNYFKLSNVIRIEWDGKDSVGYITKVNSDGGVIKQLVEDSKSKPFNIDKDILNSLVKDYPYFK